MFLEGFIFPWTKLELTLKEYLPLENIYIYTGFKNAGEILSVHSFSKTEKVKKGIYHFVNLLLFGLTHLQKKKYFFSNLIVKKILSY